MKKLLLPSVLALSAVLLYNCDGDDTTPLNPANESSDTIQPVDSTFVDTVTYPVDYPPVDTVPQDTVSFPVDSIPGDTVTVIEPYPGESLPPIDSVYTPVDSTSNQRMAQPRKRFRNH